MPRDESRAVEPGERNLVERESRGERGDGPHAVARGARALGVAARAEVAGAGRADPVLAEPIAVVHEVALGRRVLGREVLVAAVAIAKRPLILVLVTPEAGGHLGSKGIGVLLGDGLMATHTVAMRGRLMSSMLEAKVLARAPRPFACVRGAMAPKTRVLVVRLRMAATARRFRRQVKRLDLARRGHPLVTVDAIDPVRRMRAMLEGMGLIVRPQTEHAGARRQRERRNDEEGKREFHCLPQLRERRASALAS
jgi:hypothetical protein